MHMVFFHPDFHELYLVIFLYPLANLFQPFAHFFCEHLSPIFRGKYEMV